MVRESFTKFLAKLSAFYERKVQATPGTADIWFDKVKHIPDECLPWIEKKIQDECDHWPHNITMAICEYHRAWQESNPDKRAPERHWECTDCSDGLIFARKVNKDTKVKYRYVFKCLKCKQSKYDYPLSSVVELIRDGYEVV